jgi:hypothetical protein
LRSGRRDEAAVDHRSAELVGQLVVELAGVADDAGQQELRCQGGLPRLAMLDDLAPQVSRTLRVAVD